MKSKNDSNSDQGSNMHTSLDKIVVRLAALIGIKPDSRISGMAPNTVRKLLRNKKSDTGNSSEEINPFIELVTKLTCFESVIFNISKDVQQINKNVKFLIFKLCKIELSIKNLERSLHSGTSTNKDNQSANESDVLTNE